MSGLSREVPPRRRADIAARANTHRQQFQMLYGYDPDCFPVVDFVENVVAAVLQEFVLEVVDDHEMRGMEGATFPDELRICLPNKVYEGAVAGDPRSRFTVAHELGHLFLHRDIPFARLARSTEKTPAYSDSEWQANEYAGALLMPRRLLEGMTTIQEISERCGVSWQAAMTRAQKLGMKKATC